MKRALGVAVLMAGVLGHRSPVTADTREGSSMTSEAASPTDGTASPDVLEKCAEDPPREADAEHEFDEVWPKQRECGEVARAIVKGGTDADRERLWSVFDALPEASPMVEDVLEAFLDQDLERALAALPPAPAAAPFEAVDPSLELPAYLRDASEEMQQAWRLYQSAEQAHLKMFARPVPGAAIAFQSNAPAFQQVAAAFLRGRVSPADVVRDLSRFEWAGSCGAGRETLDEATAKVLRLAYLQLGRPDLALAAGNGGFAGAQADVDGDPRLVSAAGVDWERFDLGGVLSFRLDLAEPLARQGSARAARSLLAAANMFAAASDEPARGSLESLLWPLAALVEPGEHDGDLEGSDSREVSRASNAEPLPTDVQDAVLDMLARQVGAGAGRDEAETAAYLLFKLRRPESRPAFQVMLQSPFEQVRKQGAAGLRAFGETVADPLPSRPVSLRLVVDGRPLRSAEVSVMFESEGRRSESGSGHTDSSGVLQLERDQFVDPRRRLVSIQLGAGNLQSPEPERFKIDSGSLTDLDTVTTVSIYTGALTVMVPPELVEGSPPPTLALFMVGDDATGDGEDEDVGMVAASLPVASTRVVFPHLQRGRYRVWLERGLYFHESPIVEVGPDPATTTVSVDPAYSPDEEPEERAASPTNQPL